MPTLKSVKLLCYRVLRGAPLTPRTRYRPSSSSPEPFSILVSVTVLHPRLRNRSPFSFSALFTGFVSGTVLHPRFRGYVLTTRRQTLRRCRCLFFVNFFQDDVFGATCKCLIDKCLTLFRVVKMPTLKSVKLLCYRVLRGAPQTPRIRYRPPSSSPEPFSILVFSPVHRIRLQNRHPSSSPEPFSILVFSRPVFLDVTKKCAKNRYL